MILYWQKFLRKLQDLIFQLLLMNMMDAQALEESHVVSLPSLGIHIKDFTIKPPSFNAAYAVKT
ncbi:hypothetical protein DN465_31665 [Burkholderia multivorans]|nr:hypothetical protein DN465_31665 [Burkholderia multivorans]RAD77247.1 hypothetical protein DN508_32440 [Burkholderia multivorans]